MTSHAMFKSKRSLYLLIAIMGFAGACLRYAFEYAFPAGDGIPFATLGINIAGCFAMEIVNLYIVRRTHAPQALGRAIGVGFVGAFTTLSAFSTETLALLNDASYVAAIAYITLTFVLTTLAALAGKGVVAIFNRTRLARFQNRRRGNRKEGGR